ncbi:LPS sulfotransferase NodH [Monaibacterium marinum]|uniref:LPS sulfotransferase NodH n=1 Tax=Pontivivens marinum TaxID=1690039 RepID=A0A2C9CS69_9RHOB|nr:Stf0 family sulfotransferase [Monaibacterium marinum]SOH94097.1 LPS sulfotransferase NodH [Monaibacterium marinum]
MAQPYQSYILCTTSRSGSTLLCTYLDGLAGHPKSYFHAPDITAWARALNLPGDAPIAEIVDAAGQNGTGDTPLFGLRLMRKSFALFMQQLTILHPDLPSDAARIDAAFGRTAYIHLTRQDTVAQAVSFVMAEQSGLWHRNADGSERERASPPQTLHYDHDAIARNVADLHAYQAEWQGWFAQQGIQPLTIRYEDLAATPTQTLTQVFTHLGLDSTAAQGLTPQVAPLSNAISADWIARYRATH